MTHESRYHDITTGITTSLNNTGDHRGRIIIIMITMIVNMINSADRDIHSR